MRAQVFEWALASVAIVGVVLNIKHVRACFAVWMVTNVAWAVVDATHGIWAQAFLHVVYLALSVWGWVRWKGKEQVQAGGRPNGPVSKGSDLRDVEGPSVPPRSA